MNISGETRILKDDRGVYKTTLVTSETNKETGEEEKVFMKINVGFRKGVEVKNKTKINVKEGFISFFRVDTGDFYEDGRPIYKYFPKFIVMDFDIVEDGVDEVQQTKDYSGTSNNFSDDSFGGYSNSDDLPF